MLLRTFTTIFLILLYTSNSFGRPPAPTKAERMYKRHNPHWREQLKEQGGYGTNSELREQIHGSQAAPMASEQALQLATLEALLLGKHSTQQGGWPPRFPSGQFMSPSAVYQKYGYGTPPPYTGPRFMINGSPHRPIRVGDHIEYQRLP